MIPYMLAAGYVLAGGASRRMGRDKALLPFQGSTLLEFVAHRVQYAAGSVTIVGPDRYLQFGFRTIPDRRSDCGPLAGIESALLDTSADWNLIVACDMPGLEPKLLRRLLDEVDDNCSAVIAETPDGRDHPLCAVYHRRAAVAVTGALDNGVRKVLDGLRSLRIKKLSTPSVRNVNTPSEWAELVG